jgi:hypothetical protein
MITVDQSRPTPPLSSCTFETYQWNNKSVILNAKGTAVKGIILADSTKTGQITQ